MIAPPKRHKHQTSARSAAHNKRISPPATTAPRLAPKKPRSITQLSPATSDRNQPHNLASSASPRRPHAQTGGLRKRCQKYTSSRVLIGPAGRFRRALTAQALAGWQWTSDSGFALTQWVRRPPGGVSALGFYCPRRSPPTFPSSPFSHLPSTHPQSN